MHYFKLAEENYKRSHFYKSLEFYEASLRKDPLSTEQKIYVCEQIQKINRALKKKDSVDVLELLSDNYFETGVYDKSSEINEKLFKKTEDTFYLERLFKSRMRSGEVYEAKKCGSTILERFCKEKRPDSIVTFVNQNKNMFSESEACYWTIYAHILAGNVKGVEDILKNSEQEENERQEICLTLFSLTSHSTTYWQSSKEIRTFMWDMIVNGPRLLISKKRIVKLLQDVWLSETIDHDILTETSSIIERYHLLIVGRALAQFSGDLERIDYYSDRLPLSVLRDEEHDLGEDLFQGIGENEGVALERKIAFLVETGKNADALKVAYRLIRQDPKNLVANDLINHLRNKEKDEVSQFFVSLYENEPNDSVSNSIRDFKTMVNHFDSSYILNNYEDIVISFNFLKLPEVSLHILKKLDWTSLSEHEYINAKFLNVETLLKTENYFGARDLAEDVLAEVPLIKNEKVTFLYLRAESNFGLGYFRQALRGYLDVKKLSPGYRLTNERIRQIEANK